MSSHKVEVELDTSKCEACFQVKVRIAEDGTPIIAAVEMLSRGDACLKYGTTRYFFKLPNTINDLFDELIKVESLPKWTQWLLAQANLAAEKLPANISIGINVDPRELETPGFIELLESSINQEYRERVVIELTETYPIATNGESEQILNTIVDDLHIRLSIDDFCKIPKQNLSERAYSHIYYLATLPVSELKVDMSCSASIIEERGTAVEELVRWICDLPKFQKNITVVVEGIETNFPKDFLDDYAGNKNVMFQGYRFSENISMDELLAKIG